MISYVLRIASLRKLIYELQVTFYELQFQKNQFTSCITVLLVEIQNL